jgi:hypothetical protein
MRRLLSTIALSLLLVSAATGQTWVVEQVDSAASSRVALAKAADGRLWACYATTGGQVRVACLGDSGWAVTDMCTASVTGSTFLAAGPHGELCLTCYSSDSIWLYRLVGDTWRGEPYPFPGQSTYAMVAYDSTGRLHTAFVDSTEFWAGQETDSGWVAGPAARLDVPWNAFDWWTYASFTVANDCSPWYIAFVGFSMWNGSQDAQVVFLHFTGGSWVQVHREYSDGSQIPLALVPHGDSIGYVTQRYTNILYNGESIAGFGVHALAGLAYTREDIPVLAWVPVFPSYPPQFAYKTAVWHFESIPGPVGGGGVDVEVDDNDQVVVVYTTKDSGLWCARGMAADVVGVPQASEQVSVRQEMQPTVVRGLLLMPAASGEGRQASGVLLDAVGRKVMALHAGANDVRALAPGVYFVRSEPSAESPQPSAVTKIVLAD